MVNFNADFVLHSYLKGFIGTSLVDKWKQRKQ